MTIGKRKGNVKIAGWQKALESKATRFQILNVTTL